MAAAFARGLSAWSPPLRPHAEGMVSQEAFPSLGTSVSSSVDLAGPLLDLVGGHFSPYPALPGPWEICRELDCLF